MRVQIRERVKRELVQLMLPALQAQLRFTGTRWEVSEPDGSWSSDWGGRRRHHLVVAAGIALRGRSWWLDEAIDQLEVASRYAEKYLSLLKPLLTSSEPQSPTPGEPPAPQG